MRDILFDVSASPDNVIHSLDPRAKIIILLGLSVLATTTPADQFTPFIGYSAFLLLFTIIAWVPPFLLLKRFAIALPFIGLMVVVLPFMTADGQLDFTQTSPEGWQRFSNVSSKAFVGIYCLSLLTATTRFESLMAGFAKLRIPALFLMMISVTYRYLFVLASEAQRMKRARDARLYGGRWFWHAKVVGQMIGTLFLRAFERGERVHMAMSARGYKGQLSFFRSKVTWCFRDTMFTLGSLLLLLLARFGHSV